MSINLNMAGDDQKYQRLLEQKALIEAQLAAFQTASAPSNTKYDRHSIQASRQAPRSFSFAGTALKRTVSLGQGKEAIRMSGSLSQPCPAPSTTGNAPRVASSPNISMATMDAGRAPAFLQSVDCRRGPSALDLWPTRHDDSMNDYTLSYQGSLRCPPSQVIPEMVEMDLGEDPMDYFERTGGTMPTISIPPSPIDIPNINCVWRDSNYRRPSISSPSNQAIGITTPTTPSSATLTTSTPHTSEMSRQSSFSKDAILGPFEMMNVHSNTSVSTENNSADETQFHSGFFPSSYPKIQSSNEEQDLLLVGTGGPSHESHFSLSYENDGALAPFTSSTVEDMKRSESKESSVSSSSSSSSSSKSRAAAQLQRLNQLAARPIAPKAGCDENSMSRKGSLHVVRIKEEKVVAAISRTAYQRPKHDRVFCELCSEYPEGFRGPHELGRHQDRQHKDTVKKFVCIEPVDGPINPEYQPVIPLSKCKACLQDKRYGAYYNAAAHLRRAHFRPKSRGRVKSSKFDDKSEKRGGKGGGSWPPMTELKRWMKEVCEVVSENQVPQVDDDEEEDDVCSGNGFDDDLVPQTSNGAVGQSEFVNSYFSGDALAADAYPTPTSTFDNQGLSNMQFEQHQQNIDVQTNLSQSFADSQFPSMHDSMTYIDAFPQSFEDHSFGPYLSYV